jgi:DNA polymerase-3 subunit epsilon
MPQSFQEEATFTALDFETATSQPSSVCQIGLVRFEEGEIVEEVERFIQPPKNTYFYKNIEIHGIQPEDTIDAPTFEYVWWDVKRLIEDQVVVAHNSSFDVNCLRSSLAYYEEIQPEFEERCTRVIYGRGLAFLAKKYHISLDHHNALSDARACGLLYLKHLQKKHLPKTGDLFS